MSWLESNQHADYQASTLPTTPPRHMGFFLKSFGRGNYTSEELSCRNRREKGVTIGEIQSFRKRTLSVRMKFAPGGNQSSDLAVWDLFFLLWFLQLIHQTYVYTAIQMKPGHWQFFDDLILFMSLTFLLRCCTLYWHRQALLYRTLMGFFV